MTSQHVTRFCNSTITRPISDNTYDFLVQDRVRDIDLV